MANQVPPIKLNVKLEGLEELTRLKSAFKGLASTIDITDDAINKAVNGIKEYVATANNSEAVIKGQVEAFRKLKSQADITGSTYKKLDGEIKRLEQELKGASEGLIRQRDSLIKSANSTKNSSAEVGKYINQLKKLQAQTRASSQAFNDIESDIESLTFKMRQLRQEEIADFGKNAVNATRGAISGLQSGVQQSISLFKRLGEQSKTAFGQVARTIEGITAIGVGGAIAGGGAGALGGLSGLIQGAGASLGGLKSGLGAIPFAGEKLQALVSPEAIARLNEAASNVAALQAKVAGLDQAMDAVTNAFTAFGPTASAGAIAASAGIAIIYDRLRNAAEETRVELEKSFTGIDDEVQDLIRSLTKLRDQIQALSMTKINELLGAARQRFAAAPAGSPLSRSMASQIAGLEAVGRGEASRQAVVLEEYRQRVRGTSEAAVDLSQRLSFLKARLQEVDTSTSEGKAEFASLSSETVQLSDQIRKLGDSYRHVSTMATQAATAQENAANAAIRANYFNRAAVRAQEQALADLGQRVRAGVAGTPLALPAAGQTTAAGTGAAISGGARRLTGQVEMTFDVPGRRMARTIGERAGYYNPPTPATGAAAAVGQSAEAASRASKSYRDLLVNLRNVLLASNNSISSLEQQRAAWNALRSAVDPASKQFANASKQIEGLDARLRKLQSTQQRRRMSGMRVAQAAGAAISGGIFGGPEGFFGGALGGIFGGLGGAFAGAAAGAQVGMLRQQLGGFADYAAQIQKMKIALEGAAGSQEQFNQALSAANSVVRNLNVPQDVAIKGMTQLTAAVKGAGGEVSDAELVFKNVTSAIKATGGSAQDVDGAITAMVQVFSKGKVSAEEISGQLGERLPGAVTKFAKANNMTLPEFQKQLEQGRVGLRELMNFIIYLGNENTDVADKIAKSSQDAGARLTVAYNNMRIGIGKALQPLGAQLQETFARFITDIAPAVTASAKGIADAFAFFLDNKILSGLAEFALKLGLVTAATVALRSAMTALAGVNIMSWFTGVSSAARITGDVMAASAVKATGFATAMRGLLGVLRGIAALGAITVAIDVVVRGFTQLMAARQALRELNARRDVVGETGPQPAMTAERRYTGAAREKVAEDIDKQREYAARLRKEIKGINDQLLLIESIPGAARAPLFTSNLRAQAELKKAQLRDADEVIKLDLKTFKTREQIQSEYLRGMNERFKGLAEGDGDKRTKSASDKAAREAQRTYEKNLQNVLRLQDASLRMLEIEEMTTLERQRQQLVRQDADAIEFAIIDLKQKQLGIDIRQTALNETNERLDNLRVQGLNAGLDVSKTSEEIAKNQIEYKQLQLEREKAVTEEMRLQLQILESMGLTKELRQAGRQAGLGVFEFGGGSQPFDVGGEQLYQPEKFMSPEAQRFQQMKQDLQDLVSLENQVSTGALAIGNAFSSALTETISGSKSAKDALADMLASIGESFIQMAQQIITQQLAMIIYGTIMKALGIGLNAGGAAPNYSGIFGSGQAGFNPSVFTGPSLLPAAKGAAFAQNGIQPFAMGGIVTKPTFFKYANGGTFGNGVMGEAGPEAIMPLKRGADGKLGVAAKLDGAMGRYRRSPGSAGGSAGGGVETESGAAAAAMQPIDVRYSVERINQVDYVTADQFQAGMRQAAAQGAKQGEQRALSTLRQNTNVRRSVGI